jgi:hypothetical protein
MEHVRGSSSSAQRCTARQKYRSKACQGERVSREKLETAVLRQLTGIYRDGPLIHDALNTAQEQAQRVNLRNQVSRQLSGTA